MRRPDVVARAVFAAVVGAVFTAAGIAYAAGLAVTSTGSVSQTRDHGSALTCSLTALADTYVNAGQPGTSFGSETVLTISNSSSAPERVLVHFDLSGCTPAIAPDAIVHSAYVRLTTATLTTATSRTYELHRVTASWSEATTWSSQPGVAASATSSVTIPPLTLVGTTIEWSAARDVQAFITGDQANLGWRLADSAETGVVALGIDFNSREAASSRPRLVIAYAP